MFLGNLSRDTNWRHPISGRVFPEHCGARHPITKAEILIVRGEDGFHHWPSSLMSPEAWNRLHNIDEDTAALMAAMSMSSLR
jgi:hypothetical protein